MKNVNHNESYMKVADFIQEFRDRIGDSSKSIPPSYIISYLNTALRRLARTAGLERLLEQRNIYELAAINKDGTPSAAWSLGEIGTIIDIKKIKILKASEPCIIPAKYMESDIFFESFTLPEKAEPGNPEFFTIEQIGPLSRLLFNRPVKDLVSIDIKFSAFHPRITTIEDNILINYNYCDVLTEYCIILQKIESTDQSTARALWEDLDVLTGDLREQLARQKTGVPNRRMLRSF